MDRNYLVDLALSIMQDAADEWHIKEALSGAELELSNIDPEEMPELFTSKKADLEDLKKSYYECAVLRRAKTDLLGEMSPKYDFHWRCRLKHCATAFVQMTEVYLADPTDTTYDLMVRSEERYWEALKKFMGVQEIPNCGRCLSDALNLTIKH